MNLFTVVKLLEVKLKEDNVQFKLNRILCIKVLELSLRNFAFLFLYHSQPHCI